MAFELDYPHSLPLDDVRARLHALGDYLANKYGLTVTWIGDNEAKITGRYLVVTIDGTLILAADRVRFNGKDPGLLWRGKAKDYLGGKLARYLDASASLEALPRR
jgi:hypothetical protein